MNENWRRLAGHKGGMSSRNYRVNTDFFKEWCSQMAYILGFIFSDGNIYCRTLSWDIQNSDKNILKKINKCIGSNYPIEKEGKKRAVRLRINSVTLVNSLKQLGVIPSKSKCCKFPKVPNKYLRDFIRGVLDGDGWISVRSKRNEICIGFSSGSHNFLKELANRLTKNLSLTNNNLRKKKKNSYQIEWYATNAIRIISYLYNNLKKDDLYLQRKFNNQIKAKKIYEKLQKPKLWRRIEQQFKMPMKKLLNELLNNQNLTGIQIAEKLNVHSSSIYRWLEKTNVRLPVKKSKKIIITNCPVCNKQIKQQRTFFIKYCSPLCRATGRQTGKVMECIICNKRIYRAKWWSKVNTIPICSRECAREWQSMRVLNNLIPRCKISGRFLSFKR